jgi:hypothetical protein
MSVKVELIMPDATSRYLEFGETKIKIDSINYPKDNSYRFLKELSDLINSGIDAGVLSPKNVKNAIASRSAIQSLFDQCILELTLDEVFDKLDSAIFDNSTMTTKQIFARSLSEFRDIYFHEIIDSAGRYCSDVRYLYK